MRTLYRYQKDFGRQGHIDWLEVADSEVFEKVKETEVYISDVLGKHSEICMQPKEATVLSTDPNVISLLEELGLINGGFIALAAEIYEDENQ